jgi:hypothetical protein
LSQLSQQDRREEKCIQSFGRKIKGKRPPVRPRYRWADNIEMNLKEIGWEGAGWIH